MKKMSIRNPTFDQHKSMEPELKPQPSNASEQLNHNTVAPALSFFLDTCPALSPTANDNKTLCLSVPIACGEGRGQTAQKMEPPTRLQTPHKAGNQKNMECQQDQQQEKNQNSILFPARFLPSTMSSLPARSQRTPPWGAPEGLFQQQVTRPPPPPCFLCCLGVRTGRGQP